MVEVKFDIFRNRRLKKLELNSIFLTQPSNSPLTESMMTVWCWGPYKPYIFCKDVILATSLSLSVHCILAEWAKWSASLLIGGPWFRKDKSLISTQENCFSSTWAHLTLSETNTLMLLNLRESSWLKLGSKVETKCVSKKLKLGIVKVETQMSTFKCKLNPTGCAQKRLLRSNLFKNKNQIAWKIWMGKHFKSHPQVIPLTECPFSVLFYSALPPSSPLCRKLNSTTHFNVKTCPAECFQLNFIENYLKHLVSMKSAIKLQRG